MSKLTSIYKQYSTFDTKLDVVTDKTYKQMNGITTLTNIKQGENNGLSPSVNHKEWISWKEENPKVVKAHAAEVHLQQSDAQFIRNRKCFGEKKDQIVPHQVQNWIALNDNKNFFKSKRRQQFGKVGKLSIELDGSGTGGTDKWYSSDKNGNVRMHKWSKPFEYNYEKWYEGWTMTSPIRRRIYG